MEVVLLWLDDLDDAVFFVALAWERLRRGLLRLSLASAFALVGSQLAAVATVWVAAFAYVAAASVCAWVLGGALRMFYRGESSRFLLAP
jgi:hypothetical protein